MKWFDKWFVTKCKWAWDNHNQFDEALKPFGNVKHQLSGALVAADELGWGDGLRINVKKMIGGYVVSFRVYDRVKDRSDDRHYIITDEQDFNTELGKMITMESMRQT